MTDDAIHPIIRTRVITQAEREIAGILTRVARHLRGEHIVSITVDVRYDPPGVGPGEWSCTLGVVRE